MLLDLICCVLNTSVIMIAELQADYRNPTPKDISLEINGNGT